MFLVAGRCGVFQRDVFDLPEFGDLVEILDRVIA
jgi:hypothetical protein